MKPYEDRVLILVDEAQEKTESGLYKPTSAIDQPLTGTIQAVGEGRYALQTGVFMPVKAKVGDRVLFPKHGGTELPSGMAGEGLYKIFRESDLICAL